MVATAGIIVVAGGGTAWAMTRGSSTAAGTTQLVAAKTANVTETVSASGTIAAASEADLDFVVSGRVTKVLVKAGDTVKAHQALARVGSSTLNATYEAAKANLVAASDTEADDSSDSDSQQASDAAAVTAAKTSYVAAKQSLDDATLRSTIAGKVTSVDLTRGESVTGDSASSDSGASTSSADASSDTGTSDSASSSSTASTTSSSSSSSDVVVESTSSIVNATVDDTVVKQVKKGQSVVVTPEGATSTVTGVVRSVSSVPSSTSGVVTFPVVVRITGHPSGVYAGASATMVITTKQVSNVLEIPTLAITYAGSTATVKVAQGGSRVTRTVTIGSTYGLESQVVSGIAAGERVVVTTPNFPGRTGTGGGAGTGPAGTGGTGSAEGGFTTGGFGGTG